MSAVVNGHREDENTTHARPHGHILPMLSFSASTPTDEDNPLDSNAAIAIDMTLWEQPEDAIAPSIQISSQDDLNDDDLGGRNAEAVPLIDVARDVILVDGPDGEDDEVDENAPLLAGGSRGVGSSIMGMGLRVCSDDGNIGGLGIPVNMPRRSSSHIGIGLENGDIHADMESSIASFLRYKSESGNVASSSAARDSEGGDGGERQRVLKNISQTSSSVSELRDVASHLVFEVISQAQAKASNTNNLNSKVEENERIEDPHSDERLMEIVRRFVSNIMFAAKAEAWDSMRQIQNNNNNVLSLKDEENQPILDPHSDEQLREKVWSFVSDIITAAVETHDSRRQNQFNNNLAMPSKVQEKQRILPIQDNQQIVDPYSDEHLIERVRGFVSNIMDAAQVETHDSERQLDKDNTMILPLKEEAAMVADGGVRGKRGPQSLASPASNHAERLFRGGPWYVQMGRVFSAFVSRICPCRCPTKP
ncbi:uncharacterized protein [Macrobrachium rosenbergii]|uniref:uncharacterized protein isoform X9 n=1 Tax=Macrobrachium rosenbergii TaxID=79674 RepID=UPI0034D54995